MGFNPGLVCRSKIADVTWKIFCSFVEGNSDCFLNTCIIKLVQVAEIFRHKSISIRSRVKERSR